MPKVRQNGQEIEINDGNVQQLIKGLQKKREEMFNPMIIPHTNYGGRLIERYPGDVNITNILKPVNDAVLNVEMDMDYDDLTGYAYARENIDTNNLTALLSRYHDMVNVTENHNVYDSFLRALNVIDRLFANNNFEQYLTDLMHKQALSDSELLAFQEINANLSFKNVGLIFMGMLDVLTEYNKVLQSNEIFRENKDQIFMEMNQAINEGNDKMDIARGVFEPFRKRRLISDEKFVEYSTKYEFNPFGDGPAMNDPQAVGYFQYGDGQPGYAQDPTVMPIRKVINGKEVWVNNDMYSQNVTNNDYSQAQQQPVTNMGMDNEFMTSSQQNQMNNQGQQGQYRTSSMKIVIPGGNPRVNSNTMRSDDGRYTTDQYGNTHTTIQGVDVIVSTPNGPVSREEQDEQIRQAQNPPQFDTPWQGNYQYSTNKQYAYYDGKPDNWSKKLTPKAQERYGANGYLAKQQQMQQQRTQQFSNNNMNNQYANYNDQNNGYMNDNNQYSSNNNIYSNQMNPQPQNVAYGTNLQDQYASSLNAKYQHYFDVMGFYPNTVGQNYNDEEFQKALNVFVNQHNRNHIVSYEFGVPTYVTQNYDKIIGFFPPMVVSEIAPYYVNGRYGTALVVDERYNGSETILTLQQENGNKFAVHFPNLVLGTLHPKRYDNRLNANVIVSYMQGVMNQRLDNVDREKQEILQAGVNLNDIASCLYGSNTVGNTHNGLVDNQKVPTITPNPNAQRAQQFSNNMYMNNNYSNYNDQNNNYMNNNQYSNDNQYMNSGNNMYNNNMNSNANSFSNIPSSFTPMTGGQNFNGNMNMNNQQQQNLEEYPLNTEFVFIPNGGKHFDGDASNLKLNEAVYTNTLTGRMYSVDGRQVMRKSDMNRGMNGVPGQQQVADDYNPYLDLHNPLYGQPGGDYSRITEYDPNTGRPIQKKNKPVIFDSDYIYI